MDICLMDMDIRFNLILDPRVSYTVVCISYPVAFIRLFRGFGARHIWIKSHSGATNTEPPKEPNERWRVRIHTTLYETQLSKISLT